VTTFARRLNNAKRACGLADECGSLAAFFWRYEPGGWTFVGPTTEYAFMPAMGLVNDHLEGCHVRDAAETARRR
jgi:DNA-3-methyladenine glycosylase I